MGSAEKPGEDRNEFDGRPRDALVCQPEETLRIVVGYLGLVVRLRDNDEIARLSGVSAD